MMTNYHRKDGAMAVVVKGRVRFIRGCSTLASLSDRLRHLYGPGSLDEDRAAGTLTYALVGEEPAQAGDESFADAAIEANERLGGDVLPDTGFGIDAGEDAADLEADVDDSPRPGVFFKRKGEA